MRVCFPHTACCILPTEQMEIKKGIGVSPGVVISTAVVLDAEDLAIPKRNIEPAAVEPEVQRFRGAIAKSLGELHDLRTAFTGTHGKDIGGIFDFHIGILKDPSLTDPIAGTIREQKVTSEYAVSVILRKYAAKFQQMSDRYLADRVRDIYDIERRILHNLIGQKQESLTQLNTDVVVIAHDLLPSQTAALDRVHVRGFATDVGGRTSHTAIVARALGIPAVVGLGNITTEVSGGDMVIIDGNRGVIIVNPDEDQLAEHRELGRKQVKFEAELATIAKL